MCGPYSTLPRPARIPLPTLRASLEVHNHYDDIFAYWDAPFSLTNGYTEGLNGLIKMSNRLGRGYSYENAIRRQAVLPSLKGVLSTLLVGFVVDAEEGFLEVQLSKEDRIYVKKSIHWLTLKRPGNLTPAEQKALEVVKQAIPALAMAYDFKEAFFCIYDEV
jgi:transposase